MSCTFYTKHSGELTPIRWRGFEGRENRR